MITVDKGFIASFINKQSQTESETFPWVSVVVSINMFDNYQTFADFVEILYAYKSKDIILFLC